MSGESELVLGLRKDKVLSLLKEGKRTDNRKFDEYRDVSIETGVIKNAEGSARVRLGETEVLVGTKLNLEKPYPDTPNQGSISVNVELLPLASPSFETGPPRADAIELSRVVDRSIRESKTIEFEDLCVAEGENAWTVFIDGYVLNYAGNAFDATVIASMAALLETKLPKLEDNKIVKGEYSGNLKTSRKPLLSSFAKIGNYIVLDPRLEEEVVSDARFHLATTEDDFICACQKAGSGSFTESEVVSIAETAFRKAKELRKQLW
jgi:exosome complex component RRP42